ncbi:hypothetical protein [Pantoea anthophila]|uniref:hypothetical protein n=1 Tax=Pantoea anthophila TaxID=470931 RepID=UPI002DB620FE|nr:hypothetical protein [Pantoea anthophila]MEB6223738.1 hypothetical protein [Pantoea anthophila]
MMNKLTAEKCREQFEYWAKSFGQEPDLTRANGGSNYANSEIDAAWIAWKASREALEIALPILEQQERGEGDWVECKGGLDPAEQYVEVKFRTGATDRDYVRRFMWKHDGDRYDIIAYRIIPERATNQNGVQ